jgi:hypothetical protein
VQPSSRQVFADAEGHPNCETDRVLVVNEDEATEVLYTYSVEWRVSPWNLLMVVFLNQMGYEVG